MMKKEGRGDGAIVGPIVDAKDLKKSEDDSDKSDKVKEDKKES